MMKKRILLSSIFGFTGVLAADESSSWCKTYKRGNLPTFDQTAGVWEQAFEINDAFPLGSIVLPIQISHPSVADLRVELWAQAPIEIEEENHKGTRLVKQIVLKDVGQGEGEFFQAVFADEPEIGAIKPVQGLAFLHRGSRPSVMAAYGGSEGMWTVRIENAGQTRPVVEADLVLCQIETEGADAVVGDVVQAFAGSAQPVVSADSPWTIDGQEVSEEELAAFRRAAVLSLVNMQEGAVGDSARGLFDNLKKGSQERLSLFGAKLKNSTNGEDDARWKPGQLVQGAVQGLGNLLTSDGEGGPVIGNGALLNAIKVDGEKPDKIIWSRAALDALPSLADAAGRSGLDLASMDLPSLGLPSIHELASLPKEAIDGITEKIRSASAQLSGKLGDLVPDGHLTLPPLPTLPTLPALHGKHPELSLPDLHLPTLDGLHGHHTVEELRASLGSKAAKLSDSAESWAEKRAEKRERLMENVGSGVEGARSKLEAALGKLEVPKLDLDGKLDLKGKLSNTIAESLTRAKDVAAERNKRLDKPREEFKTMLSTAAEKAVTQQLEAVAGEFDLDVVAQRLADAGVDTDELLDSLAGADLDKLLDGGLDLDFRSGLNLHGALGEQMVGQLLGIEDPQELDALWNGLKEAGFSDLIGEFLTTAR